MKQTVRLLAGSALICSLAGCGYVRPSPEITVAPASVQGARWTISGNDAIGFPNTETISVYINGNLVTSGELSGSHPVSMTGQYSGHAIQVVCPVERNTQCQVYIDGVLSATLYF